MQDPLQMRRLVRRENERARERLRMRQLDEALAAAPPVATPVWVEMPRRAVDWPDVALRDVTAAPPREERAVPCTRCGFAPASFATGLCRDCGLCRMCGVAPVEDSPQGKAWFRCALCLCATCKGVDIGPRVPAVGTALMGQSYCQKCFVDKFPDLLCAMCKRSMSTVMVRHDKKPSVCFNCVTRMMPGRFISCYFCEGAAINAWPRGNINYAICDFHVTRGSCGEGVCTPARQCPRCARHAEVAQLDREGRREARRAAPDHQGHPDGEFDATKCVGCEYRMQRGLLLPPLPQPKFWPEWDGKSVPPVLPMTHRKHNRSSRYVSVEIEVAGCVNIQEGWRIAAVVEKWGGSVVRDASLGDGGFEVNTAPAAGDYLVEQLTEIVRELERCGAYVDERCGTHVHVNTRDFGYTDMRRMLMLYARLEPALLRTQPISRTYDGRYARPCGHKYLTGITPMLPSKGSKRELITSVYGFDANRPMRHRNGHNREVEARYDALNIQSWFFRGTVECRIHSGTVSLRKMMAWASLWATIVDAAYRMTERAILSVGHDVRSSIETMMALAPSEVVRRYLQDRLDMYAVQYDEPREERNEEEQDTVDADDDLFRDPDEEGEGEDD